MAIYHHNSQIIGRSDGRSAVAAASYRAGQCLHDARQGREFDYTRKEGVVHAEIFAPAHAPGWVCNREQLWNSVEKKENRKDSQLSREIEFALPIELDRQQQIALARDFAARFVDQGMIVDVALHDKEDPVRPRNPHCHMLLTTRQISRSGKWGKKEDAWRPKILKRGAKVLVDGQWLRDERAMLAEVVNEHLALAGIDKRVDHRSFVDQGMDLVPTTHRGCAGEHANEAASDRAREAIERARENGELIIDDPKRALQILQHHQSVFDIKDIYILSHRYSADDEQRRQVIDAILGCNELIELVPGEKFSTHEVFQQETELLTTAEQMGAHRGILGGHHSLDSDLLQKTAELTGLRTDQEAALHYLCRESSDLACLVGRAGTGKSYTLKALARAYRASGYSQIVGTSLAAKQAQSLERDTGIPSMTLHRLLYRLQAGRIRLDNRSVVVLDEAGLIGSRQMRELLGYVHAAGAKLVLVGDPAQLLPVEGGAAFRAITDRIGHHELGSITRQSQEWMRDASLRLSQGRVTEALKAYHQAGLITEKEDRDHALGAMIRDWWIDNIAHPGTTSIMLAYRRKDVKDLSYHCRDLMRRAAMLGDDEVSINTDGGTLKVSVGDRLMLTANDYTRGILNGDFCTVLHVEGQKLRVKLDDGRMLSLDTHDYPHVAYGYAATIHKAQGATVDRAYIFAGNCFDRRASYVSMTRHRDFCRMYYSRSEIQNFSDLCQLAGRRREKDLALEFCLARGIDIQENTQVANFVLRERAREVLISIRQAYPDIPIIPLCHVLCDTPAGEQILNKYTPEVQLQAAVIEVLQTEALTAQTSRQRTEKLRPVAQSISSINPSKPTYPRQGGA